MSDEPRYHTDGTPCVAWERVCRGCGYGPPVCLTDAVALLREAADAVKALVLAGKAPADADFLGLGDLDWRIRAFLAGEPAPGGRIDVSGPRPADFLGPRATRQIEEVFAATTFTCPTCHRLSHNPNDARERYCGACHEWFPGEEAR